MTRAHPCPDTVQDEAIRLHAEIGWVDGTLAALHLAGHDVTRGQLVAWLEGAGVEVHAEWVARRRAGGHAPSGGGTLLSQVEFDRVHALWPLPDVQPCDDGRLP